MKTPYALTSIRATLAFDEVCLSATICRDGEKIGTFNECPDTGKAITGFCSLDDRAQFEEFIQGWWQQSDYQSLCTLEIRALLKQDANYELPINEKIRCWVKDQAGPVEKGSSWKWQTRTAKRLLRSF